MPDPGQALPKILILVKGLGQGGAEQMIAQSIPHLDRASFDYIVAYLTPWKDDLAEMIRAGGVPVICLDIAHEMDPRAAARLRSLVQEHSIDLIHSHSPYPGVMARLVTPGTSVKAIVHTEHSLPESQRWVTQFANRMTYRRADVVIAVSGEVAARVSTGFGPRPRRVEVVHGGVDLHLLPDVDRSVTLQLRRRLGVPDGDHVVGNVAHLRSQKGHDVFLRAAAQIVRALPNTSFVIVGREKEAGMKAGLETLAESLGIEQKVHFAGFQKDPYPYLAMFDVFMMTSNHEGFPIALIESMALARPVVATDVGGVSEAISDHTLGTLVPRGDFEALADAVVALLEDDERRGSLGAMAREKARAEFSIERAVGAVEEVYREVLAMPEDSGLE